MRGRLPPGLEDSLLDTYLLAIPIVTLNFLWFVVSLPIITIFPALLGLFYATNQVAHGQPGTWRQFFAGFRTYFWLSWRWGLLNMIVITILLSNLAFYGQIVGDGVVWLRAVFLALTAFWLILQIYAVPLLFEQVKPNIRQALVNSLVIFIRRPLFTASQALVIGLVAVLSTFVIGPTWIFVSGGFIAFLANRCTIDSIAKLRGTSTSTKAEKI